MRVRAGIVVLSIGVMLAVAAPGATAASTTPDRQVSHPLHVAHDGPAGPRIVDDQGREVRLRAVDVDQLGDYFQVDPASPTVFPLTDRDGARIAGLGFDAVRLVVSWSRLEPRPGEIDQGALDEVVRAVDLFARHDVYTVVDVHQDAWGKWIATPPGATCPEGTAPAIGWDGAPRWATLTGDASTCIVGGIRESSPAVLAAWQAFLDDRPAPDGVGIQTHLVQVWGAIASRLAARPEVAGFDLLNEPFVGFDEPAPRLAQLGRFYARATAEIRQAEDATPGGLRQLVLFEPDVMWSGLGHGALVPPGFSSDPELVFSPHLYGGSIAAVGVDEGFDAALAAARTYATPLWSGEYGWFGDPAVQVDALRQFARRQDAAGVGAAWWDWRQSCGDPHLHRVVGEPGKATAVGLVRYRCPGDAEVGIPPEFATVLSRPYARAAPGVLTRLEPDADRGTLVLAGDAGRAGGRGTLELWLPSRGGAPDVTGAQEVRVLPVDGGYRVSGKVAGSYEVRVTRSGTAPSAAAPAPSQGSAGSGTRWRIAAVVGVALVALAGLLAARRRSRRRAGAATATTAPRGSDG